MKVSLIKNISSWVDQSIHMKFDMTLSPQNKGCEYNVGIHFVRSTLVTAEKNLGDKKS